jgi:hypothetical protein
MADNINACEPEEIPAEQITYANMLFWGSWSGIALMLVSYVLYVTGLLTPLIPLEKITEVWSKPVKVYLALGVPTGWDWTLYLGKGDFLNFVGIAVLAVLTIVCYVPLVFAYAKKKDMAFALIALLNVLVLVLAASGVVHMGEG